MASFTDSVPQFTPYRPEFPVEAALMVGMQKEQEFLSGIQRVQGYVSSLHGIDIMKPETRQYLEGKLGEMKTAVNSVSGDFSDQRLTNAIGGLAGKIAKDPVIQNGAISTAHFRKGQADIEQAKKDGKHSPVNEWIFMNEAVKWLNDKDYTTKFTHQYIPYRDVIKKINDVIKDLGVNELIDQNPFVTDSRGNTVKDTVTGKPIINHAIIEKHYKGKSADRIINAIYASLDAGDYQQLAMNGRYEMRDTSPLELQQTLETQFKNKKMSIVNAIAELSVEKIINNNDTQYQKELQDKIDGYKAELTKADKDYSDSVQSLLASPDNIKSKMYIQSFMSGISSAFATEERWTKYLDSPFFNNFMEEERFNLDKWYKEQTLENQRLQEERLWFEAMMKGSKEGKKGPSGENEYSYAPTDFPVKTGDIYSPTEFSFIDDTNKIIDEKYKAIEDIVSQYAGKAWDGWKLAAQEIERENEKKGGGVPLNKRLFLDNTFKQLKEAWSKKQDMPLAVEQKISQINDYDTDIETRQAAFRNIKDRASKQFPNVDIKNLTKDISPFTTTTISGKTLTFNPEDFIDFAIYMKEDKLTKTKEGKQRFTQARDRLYRKFGEKEIDNFYNIHIESSGAVGQFSENIKKATAAIEGDDYIGRRDFISEELMKSGLVGKPQQYVLNIGNTENKERVRGFINSYIADSETTGSNIHPDFDSSKMIDAIREGNKGGFAANIIRIPSPDKYGEDKFELQVRDLSEPSKDPIKMYLTPQQAEQVTNREFTAKYSKITERLKYNETTNYGSSVLNGNSAQSAYLTNRDFPNVQLPIKADVSKSLDPDKYFITLYTLDDKGEWISKEVRVPVGNVPGYPTGLTIEQVEMFLMRLNDTQLEREFKKK